jgi:hypothetical protein
MRPPFKSVKKFAVARPSVFLDRPVVTVDGVYVGYKWARTGKIFKLDPRTLDESWSISANKFDVWDARGGMILLFGAGGQYRALRPSGEAEWTRKVSNSRFYWRQNLVLYDAGYTVVDMATGQDLDHFEGPIGVEIAAVHGDRALFTTDERGDPVILFDLLARQVVWERQLFAEMRTQYGVDYYLPTFAAVWESTNCLVVARAGHIFGCSLVEGRIAWHAVQLGPDSEQPDLRMDDATHRGEAADDLRRLDW